jgi:hypothetical protein
MTLRSARSRGSLAPRLPWLALAAALLGATALSAQTAEEAEAQDASKLEEVEAIYTPLPPSERAKAKDAAAKLAARVKGLPAETSELVGCWLKKLGQDDVDDRLIRWTRVCPARTRGNLAGAHACRFTAVSGEDLEASLTKLEEVDKVADSLHFMAHLSAEALELQTRYPAPADDAKVAARLSNLAADVQLANAQLASADDKAPARYRVLQAWLAAKKSDPKSLYSPCN